MKDYEVTVQITFSNYVSALDEEDAMKKVKEILKQQNDITLVDTEFISVEEV